MTNARQARDILIVDDDPVILRWFSAIGRRLDMPLIEVAQFIDEVRQNVESYTFRLVFLDHQLMDGFADAALKSPGVRELLGATPIVVASGYDPRKLREIYGPLGIKNFVRKPITADALAVAITAALAGR
jgi:CheY-like chemotaxis protein